MVPATTYLVGFSGEIIWPLGQVSLLVKIGDEEHSTSAWMNFMVVRSHSPYNGIIGRPGVRRIKAIPSTAHEMLKFPVTGGTVTLRSSRIIPLECGMISGPRKQQPMVDQVTEEKIQVAIYPKYPKQTIAIGSTLTEKGRKKLCGLLSSKGGHQCRPDDGEGKETNTHLFCQPSTARSRNQLHSNGKASTRSISAKNIGQGTNPSGLYSGAFGGQLRRYAHEHCSDGSGAGLILTNPEGMEFTYALRFRFDATNNEAEYEALIAGLKIAEKMGVENLQANVDSRLVANQVNGTYVAKETDMI
ncbi:reverse transcriptase domain-containing protein [Tanacetum coccineum]|uniref:Reverse transcriptase domain-containing protein n=1 Tax=Tanacetum coccineum TaxID=301880 RepID=A0ABQ5DJR1_9ASTR